MDPERGSQPYWWHENAPSHAPLGEDAVTDVVVVGAGITGTTLAWTLAERDASVTLLEAGRVAGEASGRNSGFMLAIPAEPYAERIALWGRDSARAMLQVGRRTQQRLAQVVQALSLDCGFAVTGSLRLTRTEEETEDLRGSLPELRHDGFPMREVALADVLPQHAHARFHSAFECPDDAVVDPAGLVQGLAAACVRRGVRLHEHTPVQGARWQDGLWSVHALGRTVRARTLVLATNAFAPRLLPMLAPVVVPRRGQMLSTAPLAERLDPRPVYANYGYQYWRQMPDGRLVIGGWRNLDFDGETGFDTNPTPAIQTAIEGGVRDLFPGGATLERRWAGTMGFSRDGRPLVGWLDAARHLAVCAGFTGHGMGIATACTEELARVLDFQRSPLIASFDPLRFKELHHDGGGVTTIGDAG